MLVLKLFEKWKFDLEKTTFWRCSFLLSFFEKISENCDHFCCQSLMMVLIWIELQKLIDASLRQQKKLQSMYSYVPSNFPDRVAPSNLESSKRYIYNNFAILIQFHLLSLDFQIWYFLLNSSLMSETSKQCTNFGSEKHEEEPAAPPKVMILIFSLFLF